MTLHRLRVGVALVLLAGAASPAIGQLQRPAPGTAQGDAGTAPRLGRRYPAPVPSRQPAREPPSVHVSVVSPQDTGVHRHVGRQRMQRRADRSDAVGTEPAGDDERLSR